MPMIFCASGRFCKAITNLGLTDFPTASLLIRVQATDNAHILISSPPIYEIWKLAASPSMELNRLMDNQELMVLSCENNKGKEVIVETEKPQTIERLRRPKKRGIPWTEDEHKLFLLGLQRHGTGEWKNISKDFVVTKTPTQVASHAQKFKNRFFSSTPLDKRRPSINDIKSVDDSLYSLHLKRGISNLQSTTPMNPVPNAFHHPVVDRLLPPHVYNNNNNNNHRYYVSYQEHQNVVPNALPLPGGVDQLPPLPPVYSNKNDYYNVDYQYQNLFSNAFQLPVVDQLPTPNLHNNYCYKY